MAKEELLTFEGEITDLLPNANFRVKLENDHVTAQFTGYLADGFEQTINDFDEHFNDTTADWRNLHVVN